MSSTDQTDNANADDKKDVCPVCHGNGWELYRPSPSELEYAYGGEDLAIEYAKKCSRCFGFKKGEDLTQVPDTFRDADISKFDFKLYRGDLSAVAKIANSLIYDLDKWASRGKGLYLWSNTPGSGKTFLACCIGKSVMIKHNVRFRFTTIGDYIDKVGEGITNRKNGDFNDPSAIFKECEVLVLDDLGTQMDKEWQRVELFKLINERSSNNLITIYTSNYSLKDVKVDERVRSRIYKTAIELHMPEESIRQQKAQAEQNEFLKGIL